jgi:hypothetical protein
LTNDLLDLTFESETLTISPYVFIFRIRYRIRIKNNVIPLRGFMKLLSHLMLLLITISIFLWGVLMLLSGGPWLVLLIGLITTGYAIVNISILWRSWKTKEGSRKGLGIISGIANAILFLTWLLSSLDYGGLQQFEGPAVILLAVIALANWLTVSRSSNPSSGEKEI